MAEQPHTPPAAPPASPPAAPPAGDWMAGLSPDSRGALAPKNYGGIEDLAKAYIGLERTIGADKIALPGKNDKGERDWSKFDFGALGRPAKPDDYAFAAPQGATETEADKAFQAHMRPVLHEAGLAQWQVDKLASAFTAFTGKQQADIEQLATDAAKAAAAALRKEFGAAYDKQMKIANLTVAKAFGKDIEAMRQVRLADGSYLLDSPLLVRAFAKLGMERQEDGELPGAGATGFGAMTPEQAKAAIAEMEANENARQALLDSAHPEHAAAVEKRRRLYAMAHPEERAA